MLPKHQRHLPEAYQQLLQNILLGARSFSAARRTLQAMGLIYSAEQTEQPLQQLHQEARAFFTRALTPSDQLYQTKWRRPNPLFKAQLATLNRLFHQHFEAELDPLLFLWQLRRFFPQSYSRGGTPSHPEATPEATLKLP